MIKLSIVVPTRNRCDTLIHTLRTLFAQECSSVEIIVSDNFSDDQTRDYVNSFTDARLKYINTGSRLSMSANWEFALRHCNGEYITFIGDDDGFTPGGVEIALRHLERSKLPAIIWEKAEYCWPDHVAPDLRNTCVMRISGFKEQTLHSARQLESVCGFKRCYSRLPCIYNGIIKKEILTRIADCGTSNRMFCGICPDVFSSIVVAASIPSYGFLQYPVSVNGASRHSNGTSYIRSKPSDKNSAHAQFLSELTVSYPKEIMMAPSVNCCVMGELLLARSEFPALQLPMPDYGAYLRAIVKESISSSRHEDLIEAAKHTAKAVGVAVPSYRRIENSGAPEIRIGTNRDMLTQRFSSDVVENIYDACKVVGSLASAAANVNEMLVPGPQGGGKITARVRRTYEKARRHLVQVFPNIKPIGNRRSAA